MARFAALVLIAAVFAPSAFGATITVTTTADVAANDGLCSLREAVEAARLHVEYLGCTAGSDTDTINLPAGTIVLGSTIALSSDLFLVGGGVATSVVDGNNSARPFTVQMGVTVEISGLKITKGRAPEGDPGGNGGAILNAGTLTISNSVVSENKAGNGSHGGPDANGGDGGNGGAIASSGTLTLVNTTLNANQGGNGGSGGSGSFIGGGGGGNGGRGGGIYSTGPLTVTNSTIADNTAGVGGAGGFQWRGEWIARKRRSGRGHLHLRHRDADRLDHRRKLGRSGRRELLRLGPSRRGR